MSALERFRGLEARERRLLLILGSLLVLGLVLILPATLLAHVHSERERNDALRQAHEQLLDTRDEIEKAKAAQAAVVERYARPAPALAGFVASLANEVGVEIPESQDRQAVPHGKRYSERSTKVVLRRQGMLKIVHLMERIEQSGHPVILSQLNIRKRGVENDSFDVEMVISAFDRKAAEKTDKAKPAPSASAGTP